MVDELFEIFDKDGGGTIELKELARTRIRAIGGVGKKKTKDIYDPHQLVLEIILRFYSFRRPLNNLFRLLRIKLCSKVIVTAQNTRTRSHGAANGLEMMVDEFSALIEKDEKCIGLLCKEINEDPNVRMAVAVQSMRSRDLMQKAAAKAMTKVKVVSAFQSGVGARLAATAQKTQQKLQEKRLGQMKEREGTVRLGTEEEPAVSTPVATGPDVSLHDYAVGEFAPTLQKAGLGAQSMRRRASFAYNLSTSDSSPTAQRRPSMSAYTPASSKPVPPRVASFKGTTSGHTTLSSFSFGKTADEIDSEGSSESSDERQHAVQPMSPPKRTHGSSTASTAVQQSTISPPRPMPETVPPPPYGGARYDSAADYQAQLRQLLSTSHHSQATTPEGSANNSRHASYGGLVATGGSFHGSSARHQSPRRSKPSVPVPPRGSTGGGAAPRKPTSRFPPVASPRRT
eukprot:NODE_795_length_1640_cov_19.143424_g785_i0.p1 GENE.NODE_795_length_1640_cov_19.143424_g785_i0~~NODE_795_length_1640_cov_19.143424_g785_i0.p1  ORF type:complete len:528 (-),score=122.70 NODE_795_length_1640_cov_19.143424_g785_i0:57-1424(-)